MNAYYKGHPIFGMCGPAGPDGNPIGTVISYMGMKAPKDYLICDGSVYRISDYPDLADFFKDEFGSEIYFGENGSGTFAVPDMRNLFLRGYHGKANDQLSGDIGKKQDGTSFPYVFSNEAAFAIKLSQSPFNFDTSSPERAIKSSAIISDVKVENTAKDSFTSRPVNMAVLYCIKATREHPYENLYSEKETKIGIWVDGRPLYRVSGITMTPSKTGEWIPIVKNFSSEIDYVVSLRGCYSQNDVTWTPVPHIAVAADTNVFTWRFNRQTNQVDGYVNLTTASNRQVFYTMEYVKIINTKEAIKISSEILPKPSGSIVQDGVEYDYELPKNAKGSAASFSSVGSKAMDIL